MKKRFIYTLTTLAVMAIFYSLYSHSFVEIAITNGSGISTYDLSGQGSDKIAEVRTDSAKVKSLVSSGSYEAWVTNGSTSYYSVIKTGHFLSVSHVNASLVAEKEREFIGNDPDSCTNFVNNVLISYACGGYYGNLKIHVPATKSQPTYADRVHNALASGIIEGLVSHQGNNYAVIYGTTDEDSPPTHQLYQIANNFSLINPIPLADMSNQKTYSAKDVEVGFVVYDSSYSQVMYYASPQSKPTAIKFDKPTQKGLTPYYLDAEPSSFVILYSNGSADNKKEVSSEAIVVKNQQSKHFAFSNKGYTESHFCGDQKLCLLGSKASLDIYDISSDKARLLHSLNGVSEVENSANGLLVVNKTGVLNLNLEKGNGFYEYTLGDYKFNHLQKTRNGYILNLTNNKNKAVALLVNQNSSNADPIDKKVAKLQKIPGVSLVSIYGKYVYISADLGSPTYDSSMGDYTYSPATKKSVSDALNKALDSLGFNRTSYVISSNALQ